MWPKPIVPNDGSLRDQMSGAAKIRIGRQSIASMVGREIVGTLLAVRSGKNE